MKLSARGRRFAAVLVVVFVLTTVWAAYYLYAETHSSGGGSSQTTVATYTQRSVGAFAAALSPSYLYNNSTEVYGGNLTLFTPITKWINATIAYTLGTSRAANVSLLDSFSVTLSTPVWSKTLFTAVNHTSWNGVSAANLTLRYSVNVSSLVALANAIDNQLGYQGNGYTLSLDPVVSGSIDVAGFAQSLSEEPTLNFTFLGSLITPTGLSYTSTGSLLTSVPPTSPGMLPAAAPYLALLGSAGGLGGSVWVATRRLDEDQLLPLDELIRPYEEAIVATASAPKEATVTAVASFADLVKIADTLGKPILRPVRPDPARASFFVVDGRVAYSYAYPMPRTPTGVSREAPLEASASPNFSPFSGAVVARLHQEVTRLRGSSLDPATSAAARRRVRRAVDLIRAGRDDAAALEVEVLSEMLTSAAEKSQRRR